MELIEKDVFVRNLAARIKAIREDKFPGTQAKFAEKIGMSERGLQGVENYETKDPGIYTIFLMAQGLGLTVSELIGEATSPETAKAESILTILRGLASLKQDELDSIVATIKTSIPSETAEVVKPKRIT